MNTLTVSGLYKSFGEKQVLKGLELSVPEHSIFGFVGKNGAGKTTAMRSILGLLRADAGEITVVGERVTFGQTATNRYVGYLPDVPEFYPFMTPREYLRLCGECLGMNRALTQEKSRELLELVGLSEENRRIKGFSRGMKQRLGIAQALLGSPKLLICDEPTSALDPIGRKEILDILRSVKDHTTVLFSTHILSDVERICTDVAFLHDGTVAMQGSISQLKALRHREEFIVETADVASYQSLISRFGSAQPIQKDTLCFSGDAALMRSVMSYITEQALAVNRIERMEPSLESLFMEVTAK